MEIIDPDLCDHLQKPSLSDSLVEQIPQHNAPVVECSSIQFIEIVKAVQEAIDAGIHPERIQKGSSGSYFCRNVQGEILGVFKPKDEEPYGHLNPKWIKWLHRTILPCCFGRSVIIPNLGYISECCASFVDRQLGLGVVPRTEIVLLASPAFHYSFKERWQHRLFGKELPLKIGSFQLFLKGFVDSTTFFHDGYEKLGITHETVATPYYVTAAPMSTESLNESSSHDSLLSPHLQTPNSNSRESIPKSINEVNHRSSLVKSNSSLDSHPLQWTMQQKRDFESGFERLVILDYLIRNTDRGSDNWMVKVNDVHETQDVLIQVDADEGDVDVESPCESNPEIQIPTVQVAGIDHGLAFPTSHPNRIRSYPYGWSYLPIAALPFQKETADQYLPLLTSPTWWDETLRGLERLSRIDKDFKAGMWKKQKAVVRGQGYNLLDALAQSRIHPTTPLSLIRRPPIMIHESADEDGIGDSLRRVGARIETFSRKACFKNC